MKAPEKNLIHAAYAAFFIPSFLVRNIFIVTKPIMAAASLSQWPPMIKKNAVNKTISLKAKLPSIKRKGRSLVGILFTVCHRPVKYKAPSANPATKDPRSIKIVTELNSLLLFVLFNDAFTDFSHPIGGIDATDDHPRD